MSYITPQMHSPSAGNWEWNEGGRTDRINHTPFPFTINVTGNVELGHRQGVKGHSQRRPKLAEILRRSFLSLLIEDRSFPV